MDEGEVEVQSIESITEDDITDDLARESGFDDVADLMRTARHGRGRNIYLIRFRYLPAGALMSSARGARTGLHAGSGTRRNK